MIKTIIFDFGDVLIEDRVDKFEKIRGLFKLPKTDQKKYFNILHQSETGKKTTEDFLKITKKLLAPKFSLKQIENYILNAEILPPYKLLNKLKKYYRILILSNNQKNWPQKFAKETKINLKGIPFINSVKVSMRKPDLKIYQYAIKKYKLKPKETVFIDDQKKNLIPAKKLGIKTILYQQNIYNLRLKLKKLGIKF